MPYQRRPFVQGGLGLTCILAANIAAGQQDSKSGSPTPPGVSITFNIPEEPLSRALKDFAAQSHLQLVYQTGDLDSAAPSAALQGAYTPQAALERLLVDTHLHYAFLNEKTVSITNAVSTRLASTAETITDPSDLSASGDTEQQPLNQVVITGSHIRGEAPAGSTLTVYSRKDLDESGSATIAQFARLMPENFANTDGISNFSSFLNLAPFSNTGNNVSGSAAFNLYGLGPSSTLTLLNGHRLAAAGSDGSLVDISQIPASAIDHIEVLGDGASAVYGADAVAGVVNIVTRKDFDGAETGVRYGEATSGDAAEVVASQLLGHSWSTGNALLTYEYDNQGGLNASQRSYIPAQGGPFSLLQEGHRNSVLASARQELGSNTTISAEAMYSTRDAAYSSTNANTSYTLINDYSSGEKQYGLTLSLEHAITSSWLLSATGNYSKVKQTWDQNSVATDVTYNATENLEADSVLRSIDALVSGPVFSTASGEIKTAAGGSFRTEQFGDSGVANNVPFGVPNGQRHVSSGYAELAIPVVGRATAMPVINRLDISAAIRYDDYSDAGSTVNSKLGLAWGVLPGLTLKGTYGTSFRAPLLSQLNELVSSYTAPFPDHSSPTGTTDTLFKLGGNPDLKAEKSRSFTAGFEIHPAGIPHFELSGNYFHINFDERIQTPPIVSGIFTDILAPFLTRNPSLNAVQAAFSSPGFLFDLARKGPQGVQAVFSDEIANIATTQESGITLNGSYKLPTIYGEFGTVVGATHILRNDFQVVAGGPSYQLLNDFGQPPKWKGRAGLNWSKGQFSAATFANYVNPYSNSLFTPVQRVNSWVTEDLYLGFRYPMKASSNRSGNLVVALSVTNIANVRPPYVGIPTSDLSPGQSPLTFDPANASPVGRVVSLQVTKGWGGF